jgi:hypothetical protein
MAVDIELKRLFAARAGKPVADAGGAEPVDLAGSMEFVSLNEPDLALGATGDLGGGTDPDIVLASTAEVRTAIDAPTPSQLLGEGEHGHEATAAVDWHSVSAPSFDPTEAPREVRRPVIRPRTTHSPTLTARAIAAVPGAAAAVRPAAASAAPHAAPRPAPSAAPAGATAPTVLADADDGVADLQMLAGQVAVLKELVVATLAALPNRESVLRLGLRNAERLRDYPGPAGTNASWREGVVREIDDLREVAAGLTRKERQ